MTTRALLAVTTALALGCASTPQPLPRRARRVDAAPRAAVAAPEPTGCPVDPSRPRGAPSGDAVVQVAFDLGHVCALDASGSVRCTGENHAGELGNQPRGARVRTPARIDGLDDVRELALDRQLTCARLADGTVRCLGNGSEGQWGLRAETAQAPRAPWLPVRDVTDAAALSASNGTVCVARSDGDVRCWGREVGPRAVDPFGVHGVRGVDLDGLMRGCALRLDGTVRCDRFAREVPVADAQQLDAAGAHACALRGDGTVRCWGFHREDVRALAPQADDAFEPYDPGLRCVTQVATGDEHACALRTDGTVRCWGANDAGQLGDGTLDDRATPSPVESLRGARRLMLGASTSCALLDDDTVQCWGSSLWLPGEHVAHLTRPTPIDWSLR